ncbi:hypothetical protein JVU11DRAFT_10355 [Chiua virens]|nr:hypothetical protein JVU11DRAFT_10355 [Chiua virens]
MSQPMIILYDVPSTSPQPWAPNIWRIRLLLNYKRLPYRTCWVEFPDVENTLRAINAPPTSVRPDGRPVYTLPAIFDPTAIASSYLDPSGSVVSQPRPVVLTHANTIAEYLERTYPARPVIPEGTRALQTLFVHHITEVFVQPLLPILIPLSHRQLPVHVQNHFQVRVGPEGDHDISMGEHAGDGFGDASTPRLAPSNRAHQWTAVQSQFAFLAQILDKNIGDGESDGLVVTGHELTYADFAICSILIWIEKVAPHDGWARVREWDGGRWARLRERCKAYMDVF